MGDIVTCAGLDWAGHTIQIYCAAQDGQIGELWGGGRGGSEGHKEELKLSPEMTRLSPVGSFLQFLLKIVSPGMGVIELCLYNCGSCGLCDPI